MIVILIIVVLMVALAFIGVFLVKFVNEGHKQYDSRIDDAKLAEWENAAKKYDTKAKKTQEYSLSGAWRAMRDVGQNAEARMPDLMRVPVKLKTMAEYKAFDAVMWARDGGIDMDEVQAWLRMSDKAHDAWRDLKHEFDSACTEVIDEPDDEIREACWQMADKILSRLSGDLCVEYTFIDGEKKYTSTQVLPRSWMRGVLGMDDDRDDPANQVLPDRHAFLRKHGYRCRRCGRSPLSGADLKVCNTPVGQECLCENCRRSDSE